MSTRTSTVEAPSAHMAAPGRVMFLGLPFDRLTQAEVLSLLAARPANAGFGFVVTPNVQHVAMAERDSALPPIYGAAWLSLCDSRPVRMLGRLLGQDLPLVTGSDLTVALFDEVIRPGDRIAIICAREALADTLAARYPGLDWVSHVPPPGTEPGTPAFDEAVDFLAQSNARLVFVGLGAPKSEAMCFAAQQRPEASGTALCTGAALEFLVGQKTRAPQAMQKLGLEWLHRMASEPGRLAGRYAGAVLP
ncbi:MAG: WecB/TagA/CpsF family glycosyltransferase, partial [Pseudomonadota bacterium]